MFFLDGFLWYVLSCQNDWRVYPVKKNKSLQLTFTKYKVIRTPFGWRSYKWWFGHNSTRFCGCSIELNVSVPFLFQGSAARKSAPKSKICIIGAKDVVSRANYTEHWRTLKLFPGCSLKIRPGKANMFPADVLNVLSLKVVWNMQYCKQWYPWLTAESRCGQRRRKLCFDLEGRKI